MPLLHLSFATLMGLLSSSQNAFAFLSSTPLHLHCPAGSAQVGVTEVLEQYLSGGTYNFDANGNIVVTLAPKTEKPEDRPEPLQIVLQARETEGEVVISIPSELVKGDLRDVPCSDQICQRFQRDGGQVKGVMKIDPSLRDSLALLVKELKQQTTNDFIGWADSELVSYHALVAEESITPSATNRAREIYITASKMLENSAHREANAELGTATAAIKSAMKGFHQEVAQLNARQRSSLNDILQRAGEIAFRNPLVRLEEDYWTFPVSNRPAFVLGSVDRIGPLSETQAKNFAIQLETIAEFNRLNPTSPLLLELKSNSFDILLERDSYNLAESQYGYTNSPEIKNIESATDFIRATGKQVVAFHEQVDNTLINFSISNEGAKLAPANIRKRLEDDKFPSEFNLSNLFGLSTKEFYTYIANDGNSPMVSVVLGRDSKSIVSQPLSGHESFTKLTEAVQELANKQSPQRRSMGQNIALFFSKVRNLAYLLSEQ